MFWSIDFNEDDNRICTIPSYGDQIPSLSYMKKFLAPLVVLINGVRNGNSRIGLARRGLQHPAPCTPTKIQHASHINRAGSFRSYLYKKL